MSLKKSLSNKKLVKLEADLKAKAEQSKTTTSWIRLEWDRFETWVHSWFPGVKTRITTGLGVIGSGAAVAQQYVTGLPLTKYVSAEALALATAVLFTLSYWFHGMGDRTQARADELK